MRKLFACILLLLNYQLLHAQVIGKLMDSATGKPIEHAVVGLVIKANATDTSYFFSDEQGTFSISPVPSSSFSLYISSLGYKPVAKFIAIATPEKQVQLGSIRLAPRGTLLDEVVVEGPPIVIKEDTVEYRADAFKVKENALAEDLLKKLPGVTVDKDGNVTAQGKSVSKVRVNGKDFFGGDVKTATRELPANIIEKVQVIDDYGDQATISGIKEGDPEKIINFQIKKDKNKGFFGRATVGGGTQDRYQGSLNANYFNNKQQISLLANSNNTGASIFNFGNMGANRGMGNLMKMGQSMMNDMGGGSGMMNAFQNGDQSFVTGTINSNAGITTAHSVGANFRDEWGKRINVYGSYSYSHRNTTALQTTSSQNFFQEQRFINQQQNNTASQGDNHRFYFNMEYQVDSFNYLKISPTVTYGTTNSNSQTFFDYANGNGTKTSNGYNNNVSASKSPNISGNLLFNHRFRKKGRNLSLNLNAGSSESNSDQRTVNGTVLYTPVNALLQQFQYIDQANRNYNSGIRVTYSEPLSKTRTLDIAASHNLNFSGNNRQTYSVDSATGTQNLLANLSNNFENDFYSNRIGVSVRTTQKKYTYTLGFSLQPVSLQGRSVTKDSAYRTINRVNAFPIARFTYNFSKMKSFSANYSGNATQPTFTQLQDVLDLSNPQAVTRGNPLLKPAINHNINLSFNNFNIVSGRVLFANVTVSAIQNQIVNNVIRLNNAGAQLSIPENVNGFYNVLGFYTFSKPFKKRMYVLTLTGNINYNHNVNLVDSIRNIGQNWIASQGFVLEYNYKTWLQFGSGASYSFNAVNYKQPAGAGLSALQNTQSSALTISSNIDLTIAKTWIVKYDFDYTFNYGLNAAVTRNQAILTASIEKQLFKKKNGVLRLAAFDLFNQNANINRTVSANAIVDSRSNRLGRYLMLSFTWRLQKFQGQRPKGPDFRSMGKENPNAEIKVF